jgi:hypothetical protein
MAASKQGGTHVEEDNPAVLNLTGRVSSTAVRPSGQ